MGLGSSRLREESELEAVLGSRTFSRSPNHLRLLRYICAKYWEGLAGELKEYRIAVEALGRSTAFDPRTDSAVRVELHRLRQKLKQFYESEGAGHETVITLDAGSYIPRFTYHPKTALAAHVADRAREHGVQDQYPEATPAGRDAVSGTIVNARGRSKNVALWVSGLLGASLMVFFVAWMIPRWKARHAPEAAAASQASLPATASTAAPWLQDSVRIIAGYLKRSYIDRAGGVWSGDRYYNGGVTGQQLFPRPLSGTLDPALYQTYRAGEFSYDIPLKHQSYEVRLYFVETAFGPGTLFGGGEASRIFNVRINGQLALENFDPYTDAGGNYVADVRAFKAVVPAPDGFLHINFTSVRDKPFVNALEVLPESGGKLLPIRVVAQQNTFTDHEGLMWQPDSYSSGGQLGTNRVRVQGTSDPGLYAGERYGNFSYALPVAPGKYAVSLGFAETFFGPNNPGGGGVGDRIFDVYCNGHTLLHNFDVFKEAGGENRAVVRVFSGLAPNHQGKILLQFVPVRDYALLDFVQVIDQSP